MQDETDPLNRDYFLISSGVYSQFTSEAGFLSTSSCYMDLISSLFLLQELAKPVTTETTLQPSVSKDIIDELRKELQNMKDKMEKDEKKLMKHIQILTNDLDGERKERASMQIEIDRLKKKVEILEGQ